MFTCILIAVAPFEAPDYATMWVSSDPIVDAPPITALHYIGIVGFVAWPRAFKRNAPQKIPP
jgi:hypothetical protein